MRGGNVTVSRYTMYDCRAVFGRDLYVVCSSSIREGQGIRRKNGTRARMQQHWRERLSDLVVHGAGLSSVPSDALNVKLRMPTVVVDTIDEFERFE